MMSAQASQVLLVEDNPGDADLIMELLSTDLTGARTELVTHVSRLSDAVLQLRGSGTVDAVLLDLGLPDASGVDCVKQLRAEARDVPIVVLTGLADEAIAISCINAGAQDYLSKNEVRTQNLRRAIGYAIARSRERRAHERTRELELENQRVLETSRLKTDFLAHMSHELRTPLNAIIGFSQLLYDGLVQPDKHQAYLGHVLTSSQHLLQVINDILDVAKIEAGKLEFEASLFEAGPVVHDLVATLQTTIAKGQIHVDIQVDPAVGWVWLDPGRFRQVLYNYVSNALKFTPAGGRVTIRLGLAEEEPGSLHLEVEDTGIGIAPENLSALFLEFHQLDSGLTRKTEGTGLGLALTKRLVQAQGGRVLVRSRPGAGSVFGAILPCRPPAAN